MAESKYECKVEYNFLGKSGVKVSNICLGTMTFGKSEISPAPTQADEELSCKIMDRYFEMGGNFIDTANVYNKGKSEEIIGNWLQKQKRDDIVLATKLYFPTGPKPNQCGLSRRNIIQSCEESLERLKTDYIDLYQIHLWDPATTIKETFETLNDLVRCGKVRYIGVSNVTGWQLQKIVDKIEVMGLNPVISLQQQYSLLCRHSEMEEFQVCANEGIGIIPWSPLKGGLLTGKFSRGEKLNTENSRVGYVSKDESKAIQCAPAWSKYSDNEAYWKLIELMEKIGKNHGKTVAQIALRWLLQKTMVSSVIIGTTSIQQLEDNLGAATGWNITLEEMEQLDELSQPEIPYPYETVWRLGKQRNNSFIPSYFVENRLI